jgi:LCP family protein required for cell wall assembly
MRFPKKRTLKRLGLGLLFALLFAVGFGYHWAKDLENRMAFSPKINKQIEKVVNKPEGDEARNILLVGIDKRAKSRSSRSDTIVLVRVDPKSPYVYMVSIPRDSYVDISGHGKSKINHSFAWGGPALLIKTVEKFLNLPIHYFSEVDFNGFENIVDALGGVDFEIPKGWHDRELNVDVRSGNQHRLGKEALAIVRGRSFPGGDFQRIKNQQSFLSAILKQSMSSATDITKITNLASYTQTNMPVSDMLFLSKGFIGSSPNLQTATFSGKTGRLNRISYVFVDEKKKKLILSLIKTRKPLPKN